MPTSSYSQPISAWSASAYIQPKNPYGKVKALFRKENWIYPGVLAGIDFLHQLIEKAGLLYCGPCLYTVASSSNTLFLALFTSIYLNVKITRNTAISLTIISIAVSFSGSGKLCEINSTHLIGFTLVIIASILVSSVILNLNACFFYKYAFFLYKYIQSICKMSYTMSSRTHSTLW